MKKNYTAIIIILSFTLYLLISRLLIARFLPDFQMTSTKSNTNVIQLLERIEKLEPMQPQNICSNPIDFNSSNLSPKTLLANGKLVKAQILYTNPNWVRDVYKSYWHSKSQKGKFSYIPHRLEIASHRIFCFNLKTIKQKYYYDLGIINESKLIQPIENTNDAKKQLNIIIMQASKIISVKFKDNNLAVVAIPSTKGLHILSIPINNLNLTANKSITVHYLTPSGYIIDSNKSL